MDPSNGVSNANGVEKIAVYDQYFASSRVVNGATVKYCKQSAPGPRKVDDINSTKRQRSFIAGD